MNDVNGVVARAKEDLARRAGLAAENIAVKEVQRVTWPDASLGCPRKGGLYAQVLTPGYRLLLSDGTTDFEYHTDDCSRVVLYRGARQPK